MGSCPSRSESQTGILASILRPIDKRAYQNCERIMTDGKLRDVVIVEKKFEPILENDLEKIQYLKGRNLKGILKAELSPIRNVDGSLIGRFWLGVIDLSDLIIEKKKRAQKIMPESEVRYLLNFLISTYRDLHSFGLNGPDLSPQNIFLTHEGLALKNPFFDFSPETLSFRLNKTESTWKSISSLTIRSAFLDLSNLLPAGNLSIATMLRSFKETYSFSLSSTVSRLMDGHCDGIVDDSCWHIDGIDDKVYAGVFDGKFSAAGGGTGAIKGTGNLAESVSKQILGSRAENLELGSKVGEATIIVNPDSPYSKENRAKKSNNSKLPFNLEAQLVTRASPVSLHAERISQNHVLSNMILGDKNVQDNEVYTIKKDETTNKKGQQSSLEAFSSKRKQLKMCREKAFIEKMQSVVSKLEVDEDKWRDTDYLVDYFYSENQQLDPLETIHTLPKDPRIGNLPTRLAAFEASRSIEKKREDLDFFQAEQSRKHKPVIESRIEGISLLNKFRAL